MGICFSKKKAASLPPPPPPNPTSNGPPSEKNAKTKEPPAAAAAAAETAEKKPPVFLIAQNKKPAVADLPVVAERETKKKQEETPKKNKIQQDEDLNGAAAEEPRPVSQVRTSSCTKEELDAILIQCGRLSRSSSGKTSNEAAGAGGHRRYSGSKRSYDFDNDRGRDDGEEWEKPSSRPSPHRRTPSREREGAGGEYKRSGSRERGSNGGRRVSRSPGRRSDGPISSTSSGDKAKQPAKMVSVPAREKSADAAKRTSGSVNTKRAASPRSRSPANPSRITNENAAVHHSTQPHSLSRSSSRKAEQSPHRRNPMAEIDDNTIRGEQQHRSSSTKLQKSSQSHQQKSMETSSQTFKPEKRSSAATEISNCTRSNCVREQLMSCKPKDLQVEPEIVQEEAAADALKGVSKGTEVQLTSSGVDSLNPRTITRSRSSRRSSRDLDHALGSYASTLLEDIQNYHQQNSNAAPFSLPACVSKACSILEAVADLNSSISDNKSHEGEGSSTENGRFGRRGLGQREPFVESEVAVKDDLMEPSLHKYITVRRGEVEPQESAGSNSFVGQPWASSPLEPNSAESTDRRWTEEGEEPLPESACDFDARGHRMRLPGSSSNSGKKRDFEHRQLHPGGGSGGGRALSLPAAAAASF